MCILACAKLKLGVQHCKGLSYLLQQRKCHLHMCTTTCKLGPGLGAPSVHHRHPTAQHVQGSICAKILLDVQHCKGLSYLLQQRKCHLHMCTTTCKLLHGLAVCAPSFHHRQQIVAHIAAAHRKSGWVNPCSKPC